MSGKERKPHQFQPGNPGGPGRKVGSRNKLGEAFVTALLDDFNIHGVAAIVTVREEDPSTYVRTIAGLLPKEMTGEDGEPLFKSVTVNFVRPEKKPAKI